MLRLLKIIWMAVGATFSALVLATVGLVVACTAGWLPASSKPHFFELDGPRQLNCYGGLAPSNPLTLEFLDEGYTAVLRSRQTEATLKFEPGHVSDVWTNGEIELTIDPEIYISGLDDHELGPCERR